VSQPIFVGLNPWLPAPLSRSAWWTKPVRAERLAIFRIGLALVLLADILVWYLPHVTDFFGSESLGSPEVFADRGWLPNWHWSLFRGITSPFALHLIVWGWAVAALGLLLGVQARLCALICWAISISFLNLNFYVHNAGDTIRIIGLFYLMLSPCGAVWSLAPVSPPIENRQSKIENPSGPVYISPWPLRLLFLQLVAIVFFAGLQKTAAPAWRSGEALHYFLADLNLARWPAGQAYLPLALTRAATWFVLAWEIALPLLVLLPMTRVPALVMGVLFHVGLALTVELGPFQFYALCLYLPLLPWERLTDRRTSAPARAT
jgi:hypothetical protein